MKNSRVLIFIVSLFLLSGLLTAQAATTFDLDLSNLNGIDLTAVGLTDIENIESLAFFGIATLELMPSADPITGTFSEDGTTELKYYDNGSGYENILSVNAELQMEFANLTGTYDNSSGATVISFDLGQTLDLFYSGVNTTYLAQFALGAGSGGVVVDASGNPVVQTYYLNLTDDAYGIFSGTAYDFEASLTASNFVGDMYVMSGEMNAVPVPGSLLLIGSGLLGLVGIRRKK